MINRVFIIGTVIGAIIGLIIGLTLSVINGSSVLLICLTIFAGAFFGALPGVLMTLGTESFKEATKTISGMTMQRILGMSLGLFLGVTLGVFLGVGFFTIALLAIVGAVFGEFSVDLLGFFYFRRGNVYLEAHNTSQAIRLYTNAIELSPSHPAFYYARGSAHRVANNLDRAIQDYTKVVELDPSDAMAYTSRGIVYTDTGNLTQAIEDFTRVIQLIPGFVSIYLNRGDAYKDSNNRELAIRDYERYLELASDAPHREEVIDLVEHLKSEIGL